MANTYTQLNIHTVFSVKGRENIIPGKQREELYKYIKGILSNIKQYSLAVNGYGDHIHMFFEMHPTLSLSDIVKSVKANSSRWINEKRIVKGNFAWQEGYGAFSYSRTQRDPVINYIMNQEEHHKTKTFREEYLELLNKFQIKFDGNYIFEFYE
ncbi:MAG: IS200/IS605 family transposase [Bacteroidales bacterium]